MLLHLGHRLVQMCLRLLRAELWSGAAAVGEQQRLSRVTARVVPGDMLRVPAVAGHIRVVVTGAEGTRLHEEVVLAGGTIEAGRLVRATEDDLRKWLGVAAEELPPEHVLEPPHRAVARACPDRSPAFCRTGPLPAGAASPG